MKKNNKGISLVSLAVIIIATIILISVVVVVGHNYIEESNRTKTKAIVALVSDAAQNLQNDKHIESEAIYYVGHPLRFDAVEKIKGVPDNFRDKITAESMWYLIDSNSAKQLGVLETEKYLEADLKNPLGDKEIVKAVLVDYFTGEAYLVEIEKKYLGSSEGGDSVIENSVCGSGNGKSHVYSVQTCTKGSFCINCGAENPGHENGLGHSYSEPTCTAAATCTRCNEIDPLQPAKGHNFETDTLTGEEVWTTDATRHWKECTVCGTKKELAAHNKGYVRIDIGSLRFDPQYHKEVCSTCGWESVKMAHKIKYEILNDNTHRRFCELCEYSEEHRDSGWITGDPGYHWRECEDDCESATGEHVDCIPGDKLFYEKHKDENNDKVCDTCQKVLDTVPPNAFTSDKVKVIETTTNTIKVSAITEDDVGIMGYKFAIDEDKDGNIDWDSIPLIEKEEGVAEKVFTDLKDNTLYDIYIIAIDKGGNATPQYKINATTKKVPNVEVVGIPNGYVSESFTVSFEISTTDPTIDTSNMVIEYSIDGGATWTEGTKLTIDSEEVELKVRAKDNKNPPNIGDTKTHNITNFDATAPTVKITSKDGDDPTILKTTHTAVVTVEDDKTKIEPGTTIRYGWSLSDTTPPTTYSEAKTTNTSLNRVGTVEISTPSGVTGEYYLWIDKGIEDAGNNKTTEIVCSTIKFNIDDSELVLTNIRMYNPKPDITGQTGYVKTGGTIAVTFNSGRELVSAPAVDIGGVTASSVTSTDKINWTATTTANTTMPEGKVTLNISNIVSVSGKTAGKEYTQEDLIEGPVIYDKTLPELEYINK